MASPLHADLPPFWGKRRPTVVTRRSFVDMRKCCMCSVAPPQVKLRQASCTSIGFLREVPPEACCTKKDYYVLLFFFPPMSIPLLVKVVQPPCVFF